MRKKFIGVYALMAVMALGTTVTSCVDDNESASVTAIRDAKAEQLKALAAVANAEAEYNKAMAAVQNAKAEGIANETAEAKKRFEIQLKQLEAEAEAARLAALQEIKNATSNMINTAVLNYQNAATEVVNLTKKIIDQELLIKKNEAGLISAQKLAEVTILGLNRDIKKEEAKKKVYEAIGTNGNYDVVIEREKLLKEQENKNNILGVKRAEYDNAVTAFDNAKIAWEGGFKTAEDGTQVPIEPTLKAGQAIKYLDTDHPTTLSSDSQYADEKVSDSEIEVKSLNEAGVIRERLRLENILTSAKTYLGKEDDAETESTAYGQYNRYKKAYNDAKAAYEAAAETDPAKEALRQRMLQAEADLKDQGQYLLDEAIADVEDANEELKKFNDAVALLNTESAEYKEYISAIKAVLDKEGKALVDASKAKDDAIIAYDEVTAKLTAISRFIDPSGKPIAGDIEELIAQADKTIAERKADIAEAERLLINGEGAAAILEQSKMELERMKTELEMQKQIADKYKAELEDAINSGEVEVPTTPEKPAE